MKKLNKPIVKILSLFLVLFLFSCKSTKTSSEEDLKSRGVESQENLKSNDIVEDATKTIKKKNYYDKVYPDPVVKIPLNGSNKNE